MGKASGVSRGDRNRNARLERLRALVPVTNAIVGIDLAGGKQMVVVTDHDSKVIARKTFRCRAWDLGPALDWAAGRAVAKGWAGVTVSCEPTGHRWRVLGQLAADRAGAVRVRAADGHVVVAADRGPDLRQEDEKDAVLIARLTAQLRCCVPEPVDETWGRLRHLGTRREQLITEAGSQVQQMRDLPGVRVAGCAGHRQAAVPVGHLGGGAVGGRRAGPGRPGPDPPARRGPARGRGRAARSPAGAGRNRACGWCAAYSRRSAIRPG